MPDTTNSGGISHQMMTSVSISASGSASELKKSPENKPTGLGVKINQTAFIHKLYSMLEDNSIRHLISWSPSKDSFLITPGEEFSKVLSLFFKHTNVSSFVRQLNMYGFHKVNDAFHGSTNNSGKSENSKESPDTITQWEFKHGTGAFRRGDLESLRSIKRRASRQSASQRDSIPVRSISLSVPSTPPEMTINQRDAVSRDMAPIQLSPTSTFGSQTNSITPNLSNGNSDHISNVSNNRLNDVELRIAAVERYLQEMYELDVRTQHRQRLTMDILHRTQQSACELLDVLGDSRDAQLRPHLTKISGDLNQNMTLLGQLEADVAYPHPSATPGAEAESHSSMAVTAAQSNGHYTRQPHTSSPRAYPTSHARSAFFQHYAHLHPKFENHAERQASVHYDPLNPAISSPTAISTDETTRSPIPAANTQRTRGHSLPTGASPSKASPSLLMPATLPSEQLHSAYGHYGAYHAVAAPAIPLTREQRPASFPITSFHQHQVPPAGSGIKAGEGFMGRMITEPNMPKFDIPFHKVGDLPNTRPTTSKSSPISEESASSILLPPIRAPSPPSRKSSLKTLLNPNGEDDRSPKRVKIAD